jgi:hypothetical protein
VQKRGDRVRVKYPTAAIAVLAFTTDWPVSPGQARLAVPPSPPISTPGLDDTPNDEPKVMHAATRRGIPNPCSETRVFKRTREYYTQDRATEDRSSKFIV